MEKFIFQLLDWSLTEKTCRSFFKALIFFVCLSQITPSFSSSELNGTSLSLERALVMAVKSHPLIFEKYQEYTAANSSLNAARWAAFPNAGFSVRGFREDGQGERVNQEVFSVSQPVWTGGRLSGNVGIARAKREMAKLAIIEAEQKILTDTVTAFIDVHRAQSKLDISVKNLEEHERLLKIIERRVKAMTSPETDLRLANARLAFSRSQLLQNTNSLELAKADLEQLIGDPVYEITAPQNANILQTSVVGAERAAMAFSPAIRRLRAEIDSLSATEKVSKSLLYPQISLGYEKRFGDIATIQEDEQVFIGLDFQPGAGLSSQASIKESRAAKRALEEKLRALKRDIQRQVRINWRQYSAAKLQLSPTKLLVDSTSEVVSSYLRQYTVGRKSWLDVLNAQRELVQAKQSLSDHEAMFVLASYKVKILIGELNKSSVTGESERRVIHE